MVELYSDSRLIVGQVNGDFEAQDERIQGYLAKVQNARAQFKSFISKQIPRGQNSHADSLEFLATSLESSLSQVLVIKEIDTSSLKGESLIGECSLYVGPSWMDPIVNFLRQRRYVELPLTIGCLRTYKCSYLGPYLLCVHLEAVEPLLEELHEGI